LQNLVEKVLDFLYINGMKIRCGKTSDAGAINALIASHAELDRMLFRSVADIYEYLQTFKVAEVDGVVAGCCALQVVWSELGEIKSLAVEKAYFSQGLGKEMVNACLEHGRELGLKRVFTLTLEPVFFEKLGFKVIDKDQLPMKVWSDCARCSKQDHCDETAMVIEL
jgi:amino-acid N-acetyltransferase